jgi:hypothetical protein
MFRIFRIDDKIENSINCSFISSDNSEFKFHGFFTNISSKEVLISESLEPNQGIGIWLQREIIANDSKTDSEMIDDYDKKIVKDTIENVELVINYNIID